MAEATRTSIDASYTAPAPQGTVTASGAAPAARDWTALNQAALPYTSLTSTVDPVTGAATVTFAGLQARLSDILAAAAGHELFSVTVYADTLAVDVPAVRAQGLVIVARCVDLSAVDGALQVGAPAGLTAAAELLVGSATPGAPTIAAIGAPAGQTPQAVPAGLSPMQALVYTVAADGSATAQPLGDSAYLTDLVGRAWSLASLRAVYTAAAGLMDSASADDRALAQAMFNWIVATVGTLGEGDATIPSDFAELYHQAGALLVTLNVAPGGFFVPVLSGEMYQSQVDGLLGALEQYEAGLNTLAVQSDIAGAVASVSDALSAAAKDEIVPLQAQLADVQSNVDALRQSIIVLRSDFVLQLDQVGTDYQNLAAAVTLQQLAQFLQDTIDTVMAVNALGVNVAKGIEGDLSAVSDGVKSLQEGVTAATAAIDDLSFTPPDGAGLVTQAKALMQMQLALMTSFQASSVLGAQSQDGGAGDPLPASLAAVAVDPTLAWDNYMVEAEEVLTNVKESIGDASAEPAQEAANRYLASLKILAGFGKAIDGKFAAYSSQLAQATVLQAQIAAAQNVAARWQEQQAEAKSDAERLSILRSVLQGRADALKRSIYVAWAYYRASYFYVHLVEPPVAITLAMTSAQMRDAFASVSTWIAQLLGTAPDGEHVVLPNNDVDIEFDFLVRAAGSAASVLPGADVALLTPASGATPAQLSWTIPLGDAQLAGVLPQNGDVAIWITGVQLAIDGVVPNDRGNVLVSVATSGTYENGFGPGAGYTFFGKGLIGDYGYSPATGVTYIPWQIPTAVYMTPTPYTQWTMTFDPEGGDPSGATRLRMKLNVAYLAAPR